MDLRRLYKDRVRATHSTAVVRRWFGLYAWFWYHTEFWIKDKEARRPYTYIMRDWIFPHKNYFWAISAVWFAGMIALSIWHGTTASILGIFTAMLWAHLIWGSKWTQGEQEWPTVLEPEDMWTESGKPRIYT